MNSGKRVLNWNFNLDFEPRLWCECFCQAVPTENEISNMHSAEELRVCDNSDIPKYLPE